MPAGKKQQNTTVLYSLIAFVGLFLVSTTFAIIFYVKFEEQKKFVADAEKKLSELANSSEQRTMNNIIGTMPRGKSGLGTMNDYVNLTTSLITGEAAEDTTAEIKVGNAVKKIDEILANLAKDYEDYQRYDSNSIGLVQVVSKLKTDLDNTVKQATAIAGQLDTLQGEFDDSLAVSQEKEKKLLEEKEQFHNQVLNIEQKYNDLRELMKQTTEQQVNALVVKLEEEQGNSGQLKQDLLKTQSQLNITQEKMDVALSKVRDLEPLPDKEVAALQPDGKIIMVDEFAKVVHIDMGSDSHVYPGLTFAVYDKTTSMPRTGKGKAEIEVFDVQKTFSIARILNSNVSNPILLNDNVGNVIWDSKKKNVFVIAGDFDLNVKDLKNYDSVEKIKSMIEKWGGVVEDDITVRTDFLIIGSSPDVRRKPTFEEMEMYPNAMEQYEASLKRLQRYKDVQSSAESLSVPIFNYERFLYLTGYKSQSNLDGAF